MNWIRLLVPVIKLALVGVSLRLRNHKYNHLTGWLSRHRSQLNICSTLSVYYSILFDSILCSQRICSTTWAHCARSWKCATACSFSARASSTASSTPPPVCVRLPIPFNLLQSCCILSQYSTRFVRLYSSSFSLPLFSLLPISYSSLSTQDPESLQSPWLWLDLVSALLTLFHAVRCGVFPPFPSFLFHSN